MSSYKTLQKTGAAGAKKRLALKTSITPLIADLPLEDVNASRVPTVYRAASTFFVAVYSNFKNGV